MNQLIIQQKNEELLTAACALIKLINLPNLDKEAAIELEESVFSADVSKAHLEYVKSFPDLAKLIEERYIGPTIDIEALLKLPSDSLGYIFASKMKAMNLDVEYFTKDRIISNIANEEIAYIRWLMRKTHDIWHVVTGFDTTLEGELGLKGFELAQYHSTLSIFSLVIVLLKSINNQKQMKSAMEQFIQGYQMGLTSKLLLSQKWEERWEQSLTGVQSELNIKQYNV
jgi:ubiquinone biosynthesis protein Coq4